MRNESVGTLREFKDFLLRGNVVDLAVGVVIGVAFGDVVKGLVNDFITPLIAAVGGQRDFSALHFTLNNSIFRYGDFINAVLSFLLIATVVFFFVVLPMNRLLRSRQKPSAPTTRQCPECRSDIPIDAKRCRYCTVPVSPVRPPSDLPAGVVPGGG